jgi:hypothetical protein
MQQLAVGQFHSMGPRLIMASTKQMMTTIESPAAQTSWQGSSQTGTAEAANIPAKAREAAPVELQVAPAMLLGRHELQAFRHHTLLPPRDQPGPSGSLQKPAPPSGRHHRIMAPMATMMAAMMTTARGTAAAAGGGLTADGGLQQQAVMPGSSSSRSSRSRSRSSSSSSNASSLKPAVCRQQQQPVRPWWGSMPHQPQAAAAAAAAELNRWACTFPTCSSLCNRMYCATGGLTLVCALSP